MNYEVNITGKWFRREKKNSLPRTKTGWDAQNKLGDGSMEIPVQGGREGLGQNVQNTLLNYADVQILHTAEI